MSLSLPTSRWARVAGLVALSGALWALFGNARYYYPFIADDAFISLRYAERLLAGHGLTWTEGPPVEGYSNLLWILLCAACGALGIELVQSTRILGALGMAAVLVAILWVVRPQRIAGAAAALVGMLGFAVAGPIGAWTVGGLEQPLVAGLLAWGLSLCLPWLDADQVPYQRVIGPGIILALLTLSRADGAVLVAATCFGVVVVNGFAWRGWKRALWLAAVPLLAYASQLVFRLVYYDAWIPNTALVKVAFTVERLATGWAYTLAALWVSAVLVALAAVPLALGLWRRDRPWRQAGFLWIVALVWASYVLFVGGDIFPAHRHWVSVLVPLSLAAALGLCTLGTVWPRLQWPSTVVAVAAVALFAVQQRGDEYNHRAKTERWEYNGEVVGRLLDRAFGDQKPLLAANTVGSLCYYAKLPSLDMLGLNDRYLATNRPADFGTGFIGHELGDGAYVLGREPDLVIFCGPTGRHKPCGRGGKEMVQMAQFRRNYQMVHFWGTDPFSVEARIWVYRWGKIGIRRDGDTVTVPGYLLSAGKKVRAELDAQGRIGLRVAPNTSVSVSRLPLRVGRWRLRVEASGQADITSEVAVPGQGMIQHGSATLAFVLEHRGAEEVTIQARVRSAHLMHIRELVFEPEDRAVKTLP